MDLLERYLAAIARELPKAQAADVIAELRDTLLSKIEEREAGLGRKLDRKELEALLKDFGHPLVVAGRYRKTQHLIGPEVFPFWFATLRIVLGIEAAIWLVGLVITAASANTPFQLIWDRAASTLFNVAVFTVGAVTLVFAVFERTGVVARFQRDWSPRRLPPARTLRRGRFEVASQLLADVVLLAWWTGLIHFRQYLPMPPAVHVQLAMVWDQLYWPIVAYILVEMGVCLLELLNPAAVRVNTGLTVLKNLAGCAIALWLLQAGHWLQVDVAGVRPEVLAKIRAGFDAGMRLGLIGSALALGAKVLWDGWRLVRSPGPAARTGGA